MGFEYRGVKRSIKAHAVLPVALRDARTVEHPNVTTTQALHNITLVREADRALSKVQRHVVIASEAWSIADASSLKVRIDNKEVHSSVLGQHSAIEPTL